MGLEAREARFTRSRSVIHVAADHATKRLGSNPQPSSRSYCFCPYRPEWGDSSNSSSNDMVENSDDLSLSDLAFSMQDIDDAIDYLNSISISDTPKSIMQSSGEFHHSRTHLGQTLLIEPSKPDHEQDPGAEKDVSSLTGMSRCLAAFPEHTTRSFCKQHPCLGERLLV